MALRILSQRANAVDSGGFWMQNWFTLLADMVRAINHSRFTGSGTRAVVTDTTDSTQAVTIPVLAGNTGLVRLSLSFSCTDNANAKTAIVQLGDTTIQTITIDPSTEFQSAQILIVGRGASSQFTSAISLSNCTGSGGIATTENMAANNTLTVSMQLGTITDTIALESWALEVEQT